MQQCKPLQSQHQPLEGSESSSPIIKIQHGDNEDSLDEQEGDQQRSISEMKSMRLQNSLHKNKFPNTSKYALNQGGKVNQGNKKLLFSERTTLMLEESQKFDVFGQVNSKTTAERDEQLLSLSPNQKD
jgi:hypothetical protein